MGRFAGAMNSKEVLAIYDAFNRSPDTWMCPSRLDVNPLTSVEPGVRPKSASIEDAFFGDSGKGSVVAKFNHKLARREKEGKLYSLRWNGGANAGHESVFEGKRIVTHQLPMGVVQEGATAIITRGMVLHPEDLLTEINQIEQNLGGALPGTLVIDERTPLSLDTHRALEAALNTHTSGGRGSTGRGIAPGYASVYERIAVTVKDLMDEKWEETLRQHYRLYRMLTRGLDSELENALVASLSEGQTGKRKVGSEAEFIDRLQESRRELRKYVSSNVFYLLEEAWKDKDFAPFTFEGAQGAGLDPYHGVYPDVTASRPMSGHISDATYGVVLPEEIALRLAVMKTTYVSSVGSRRLPSEEDEARRRWIQKTFDEKGRSTGRLRDIYEVSIPIACYLRRAAGYKFLAATHLDASQEERPIRVITHYTDKKTGEERPYFPYQDYLDQLQPHFVEFPGWNGEEVKKARFPEDLPPSARLYLSFLSRTIAPVALATTGPELGSYISWIPRS